MILLQKVKNSISGRSRLVNLAGKNKLPAALGAELQNV
jgi:hypothetical protein